jgi:hypothetical protein
MRQYGITTSPVRIQQLLMGGKEELGQRLKMENGKTEMEEIS